MIGAFLLGVCGPAVADGEDDATPPGTYRVGVDYHALGDDFEDDAFLSRYHDPAVRDQVRRQLAEIVEGGASVVSTRLWLVTTRGPAQRAWKWQFPPSAKELANLRTYAQDVAAVKAADGRQLRLDLGLLWQWGALYTEGSPETTLGHEKLSPSEFTQRTQQTVTSVLAQVHDVLRPDGVRVVDTVYLDGEVMIGAKQNQEWFLRTHYPFFVEACRTRGVTPSLYFLVVGDEDIVLEDGFQDPVYPALNGHRSMFWVYRSVRFMVEAGLPLPARIDASVYIRPRTASYAQLAQRIFDDAAATLVPLGAPARFGVVETFYPPGANERRALGAALAAQRNARCRLELVTFWPTPYRADSGGTVASPPFEIVDYLPR